jgi:hypothetical protein
MLELSRTVWGRQLPRNRGSGNLLDVAILLSRLNSSFTSCGERISFRKEVLFRRCKLEPPQKSMTSRRNQMPSCTLPHN